MPPPSELYSLSLHDALPICRRPGRCEFHCLRADGRNNRRHEPRAEGTVQGTPVHSAGRKLGSDLLGQTIGILEGDRKSTRLNSSHVAISYAVFCLKKKNNQI